MIKLLIIFFSFSYGNFWPTDDFENLRQAYQKCIVESDENFKFFISVYQNTKPIENSDLYLAYTGVFYFFKAKISQSIIDKIADSKKGANFIEKAIASSPKNFEIRFLRFTIQENLPAIVNYNQNIKEDKKYLITYFADQELNLKNYTFNYIKNSKQFTQDEKQQLIKSL